MPMQWNEMADARLFAAVLTLHVNKLDYPALARAMGHGVTPKAISHRINKIRERASQWRREHPYWFDAEVDGVGSSRKGKGGKGQKRSTRWLENQQVLEGDDEEVMKEGIKAEKWLLGLDGAKRDAEMPLMGWFGPGISAGYQPSGFTESAERFADEKRVMKIGDDEDDVPLAVKRGLVPANLRQLRSVPLAVPKREPSDMKECASSPPLPEAHPQQQSTEKVTSSNMPPPPPPPLTRSSPQRDPLRVGNLSPPPSAPASENRWPPTAASMPMTLLPPLASVAPYQLELPPQPALAPILNFVPAPTKRPSMGPEFGYSRNRGCE